MEQFYTQSNWSGGLSDSDLYGGKGCIAEGVGVDIHSEPGVLKVSQALVVDTTTTDFVRFSINCSDGNSYWFGDTGKIYKKTSAGVWSTVHTDTQGAIIGAAEFDSYIYYASATKLGRQSVANAASEAAWASQNDSWQTLTTATYHPMTVQGLYLLIGNARTIATVDDAGTFTAAGTPDITLASLPHTHQISAITNFGIDVLVGTTVTSTYALAGLFRWDTVSAAYISYDEIQEIGINCFVQSDNYVFVQAGNQGNIYYYNGSELEKAKRIKGDYENKTMFCYPGASTIFRGIAMLGVSNLSSNPCLQGVFSLGQYDRNYPMALMLEYVISQNKTSSISIGAVQTIGSNLFVAWKDGTTYGIDKISWTTKYASAYVKTIIVGGERIASKTFEEYVITYKSLPTSTAISLSYYPNYNASDTAITLFNETDYYKYFSKTSFEAGVAQFKLAFTTSSNDAPEVESFFAKWNVQDVL